MRIDFGANGASVPVAGRLDSGTVAPGAGPREGEVRLPALLPFASSMPQIHESAVSMGEKVRSYRSGNAVFDASPRRHHLFENATSIIKSPCSVWKGTARRGPSAICIM